MSEGQQTFEVVAGLLANVFHVPAAEITRETQAADVQGWDSLAHSRVIMSIERAFALRLPLRRAFVAESVGALCDLVVEVRGAAS